MFPSREVHRIHTNKEDSCHLIIWTILFSHLNTKLFLFYLEIRPLWELMWFHPSPKCMLSYDDFITKSNMSIHLPYSPEGLLHLVGIYTNSDRLVIAGD